MSREAPRPDCVSIWFADRVRVPAAAEVALEDYARSVTRAAAATAETGADGRLSGVHICGIGECTASARDDVEAFARELAERTGDGLGWS